MRGPVVLRRSQRLWELSRDSHDPILWRALSSNFPPEIRPPRSRELGRIRDTETFQPRDDFIQAVWRDAGNRDPDFGVKLADYFSLKDNISLSIDILEELVEANQARPDIVSRLIGRLLRLGRLEEAKRLVDRFRDAYGSDTAFITQWSEYALAAHDIEETKALTSEPYINELRKVRAPTLMRVLISAGMRREAREIGEVLLSQRDPDFVYRVRERESADELVSAFKAVELGTELLDVIDAYLPEPELDRLRRKYRIKKSN